MLLALGILTACGTGSEEGGDQVTGGSDEEVVNDPAEDEGDNGGIVAGELEPSLEQVADGQVVYTVKNQTEQEMTLEFTSSQRFDYVIKSQDGEVLYHYSTVASFLQALGTETIAQGEELSYDIELPGNELKSGEYQLEVWLTPKDGEMAKTSMTINIQ